MTRTVLAIGGGLLLAAYAFFIGVMLASASGPHAALAAAYNLLGALAIWKVVRRRRRGGTGPDLVADPRSPVGNHMLASVDRPTARLDVESYVPRDLLRRGRNGGR